MLPALDRCQVKVAEDGSEILGVGDLVHARP